MMSVLFFHNFTFVTVNSLRNHLLCGNLCTIYLISIFYLLLKSSITILSYALISLISQLKTQEMTTSQIRSYLIPTDNSPMLHYARLIKKSSLIDKFSIRFNDNTEVVYFLLDHPAHRPWLGLCNGPQYLVS